MKFYDRLSELDILRRNWANTTNRSMMTVLTGRRRVGKTSLLTRGDNNDQSLLYMYVSKDNERVLTRKFQAAAEQSLGLHLFGQTETFAQLFEELMRFGQTNHFTLVLDEFQNFLRVNPAIPSHIQDIWDRYHERAHIHLIACGSIYSMMHRLFDNDDEPLYGRQDCRMNLQPFKISILKEILYDHNPSYSPEDLLCLYALTGGVAKYVAWLMDAGATTKEQMLQWVTQKGSPYLSEGTELIMSEFGKDYSNYLSILQMIARGMTTQSEIDSVIGKNTGSYLNNLEEDYNYIHRRLPIFSKPGSRNQRWEIEDCFLRFWFRFIVSHQSLVEMERNDLLLEIIEQGYTQYSGIVLEQYFRQKWMEEQRVTQVGNYWDRKGENEIDLIAINDLDKTAVLAEVKRQSRKFDPKLLERKAQNLHQELGGYTIQLLGLSLDDM